MQAAAPFQRRLRVLPPAAFVIFVVGVLLALLSAGSGPSSVVLVALGYPHGAGEKACDTGTIPSFHGGVMRTHQVPYKVRLFTEYTNVEVDTYEPGKRYDVEIASSSQSVDNQHALAGFLIRNMAANGGSDASGSWSTAVGSSVDADPALVDHPGAPHAFIAPTSTLRCNSTAVTHTAATGGFTVATKTHVRRTVRAPFDNGDKRDGGDGDDWSMRVSLLSAPPKPDGGFYLKYPMKEEGGFIDGILGEAYLISKTWRKRAAVAVPLVKTAQTERCVYLSTSEVQCTPQSFGRISMPFTGPIQSILGAHNIPQAMSAAVVVLGAQDQVVVASADLKTIYGRTVSSALGNVRSLHKIYPSSMSSSPSISSSSPSYIICGDGYGRPVCTEATNTSALANGDLLQPFTATASVARGGLASSHSSVFANGSLYVAQPVPSRPYSSDSSNFIARLPPVRPVSSSDTTPNRKGWNYQYSGGSGSSDDYIDAATDWLQQPGIDGSRRTRFGGAWARKGRVYFALSEPLSSHPSASHANAIARVCEKDTGIMLKGRTRFRSFVRLGLSCTSGTNYPLDQLTYAVPSADGTTLFAAFRTGEGHTGEHGTGICAYSFDGAGGIDTEMNGPIDPSINAPQNSFLGLGGDAFSCDRSNIQAERLTRVNCQGRAECGGSTRVVRLRREADSAAANTAAIVGMASDVLSGGDEPVHVLWTISYGGLLTKMHIAKGATAGSARIVSSFQLNEQAPAGLILVAGTAVVVSGGTTGGGGAKHVIVSGPSGAVSVPTHDCSAFTTCGACLVAADPYCGWCAHAGACTTRAVCKAAPPLYTPTKGTMLQSLIETPDTSQCIGAPRVPVISASALSATDIAVSPSWWANLGVSCAAGVNGTCDGGLRVFYRINGGPVLPAGGEPGAMSRGRAESGLDRVLGNLSPYTQYTVAVEVRTAGGLATSNMVTVTTLQAAPARMRVPTVRPLNSTALSVSWVQPEPANGVIRTYELTIKDGSGTIVKTLELEGTSMNFIDTLAPYTLRTYAVRAITGPSDMPGLRGSLSPEAAGRTDAAAPGAPAAPIVSEITATSAILTWARPQKVNGEMKQFHLYAVLPPTATPTVPPAVPTRVWRLRASSWNPLDTTYTLAGLRSATRYAFRVGAVNSLGPGPLSELTTFTTLESTASDEGCGGGGSGAPTAPRLELAPDALVLTVSWQPSTANVNGYEVIATAPGQDSGSARVVASTPAGSIQVRVDGIAANLKPCTRYAIRVREKGGGVMSAAAFIDMHSGTAATLVPKAPTLVGKPAAEFVTVAWDDALECDVARVEVLRRTFSPDGGDDPVVACCGAESSFARRAIVGDLVPGTRYTLTLRRVYARGGGIEVHSAESAPLSVITTKYADALRPGKLAPPKAVRITGHTVALTWSAPVEGVVRYEMMRDGMIVCCDSRGDATEAPPTAFTDQGLFPGTSYTYAVRGINNAGYGSFSDRTIVETLPAVSPTPPPPPPPSPPTDLSGGGAGTGSPPSSPLPPRTTISALVAFSLDQEYDTALSNRASTAYTSLVRAVESDVAALVPGAGAAADGAEVAFTVLSFSAGSVVVSGRLVVRGGEDTRAALDAVVVRLRAGLEGTGAKVGGSAIKSNSFTALPAAAEVGGGGGGNDDESPVAQTCPNTDDIVAILAAVAGVLGTLALALGIALFVVHRRQRRALGPHHRHNHGKNHGRSESTSSLVVKRRSGFDPSLPATDESIETAGTNVVYDRTIPVSAPSSQHESPIYDNRQPPSNSIMEDSGGSTAASTASSPGGGDGSGNDRLQPHPTMRRTAADGEPPSRPLSFRRPDSMFDSVEMVELKMRRATEDRETDQSMDTIDFTTLS